MIDFTTSFVVERAPHEVFDAINDVRGWWGDDVHGRNGKVGDEFTGGVQGVRYSKLRVTELIPNEKVVWLVVDNHNHCDVVEDQSERIGTTISFELTGKEGQTEIRFAHRGLTTEFECFDVWSNLWDFLMPSLITIAQASLTTSSEQGQGRPGRLEELIERLLVDEPGLAAVAGRAGAGR